MNNICTGSCLECGKCAVQYRALPVLETFGGAAPAFKPREGYGIAADIGTTTAVLALLNLYTGKIEARHSFINPQAAYGPDVISRISAANGGGLEELRRLITAAVSAGIAEILASRGLRPRDIKDIAAAGNTAMTYLLLGLPCRSLGVYPFLPEYRTEPVYPYEAVFGDSLLSCPVRIMPWLAAFVGGDITAGLIYTKAMAAKQFLLIDLGTNGEMALYDRGRLTVTSAAAGPAFEASAPAQGGGASGVISLLAGLVRRGIADETGLLTGESVFTQKQIRDLQLAKSAVRSGLEILLKSSGLGYDGLERVYLAGGIGQAMNAADAADIGLIPAGLAGKTAAAGNAALGGAVFALLAPEETAAEAEKLRQEAVEINLAAHPDFNEYFLENMYFPCFS
ncbi:MAG: ASKHA domain-containing protein [Clostridiales bacterium]|jgi:uncharacterized 2Fe-2S/4Fe-4S cluster protein (DUF4445 family)|nr:ASKHA domain-containing protein [Clostridiales bacterium]